jgi:hypothetical protein
VGLCNCTRAGLLLLILITFSNVVNFIFVARSIWIVSAAMGSAMSWGRAGSRRGYNPSCNNGVSFHDRDG